jgi:hypothetical protein
MKEIIDKLEYFEEYESRLKKLEMEIKFQTGKFNDELREFLKVQGLPDAFSLVAAIRHFTRKIS